ncbi:hypothetical protein Vafri_9950 [Volvox africanus]|uniref:Uncharacterized protein n=1 Tax=Volvox africanus TaxID=51714 RepID=A0A8J4B595_9CHLO|nr:hypothetical protein Vafri_9950 [Volvox africanus]
MFRITSSVRPSVRLSMHLSFTYFRLHNGPFCKSRSGQRVIRFAASRCPFQIYSQSSSLSSTSSSSSSSPSSLSPSDSMALSATRRRAAIAFPTSISPSSSSCCRCCCCCTPQPFAMPTPAAVVPATPPLCCHSLDAAIARRSSKSRGSQGMLSPGWGSNGIRGINGSKPPRFIISSATRAMTAVSEVGCICSRSLRVRAADGLAAAAAATAAAAAWLPPLDATAAAAAETACCLALAAARKAA